MGHISAEGSSDRGCGSARVLTSKITQAAVTGIPASVRTTLVGDIGGTNARFAIVGAGRPESRRVYQCADYPEAHAAIEAYLAEIKPVARPQSIEPTVKPTTLASITGRRPKRVPSQPASGVMIALTTM